MMLYLYGILIALGTISVFYANAKRAWRLATLGGFLIGVGIHPLLSYL